MTAFVNIQGRNARLEMYFSGPVRGCCLFLKPLIIMSFRHWISDHDLANAPSAYHNFGRSETKTEQSPTHVFRSRLRSFRRAARPGKSWGRRVGAQRRIRLILPRYLIIYRNPIKKTSTFATHKRCESYHRGASQAILHII